MSILPPLSITGVECPPTNCVYLRKRWKYIPPAPLHYMRFQAFRKLLMLRSAPQKSNNAKCFPTHCVPLRPPRFASLRSLRKRYSLRFAPFVFISRPPSQGGELRPPHCPRWASLAAPLRFAILYINGNLIMFSAVMRHRLKHNPVYVKYPASPAPLLPSLRFASFGACFASLRPPSSVAPLRYAPPASSLRFVAPLRSAPFFNAPLRVAPLRNDIFSIAIFPRTLRVLQNPPQKNVGKRFYLTKVKYS